MWNEPAKTARARTLRMACAAMLLAGWSGAHAACRAADSIDPVDTPPTSEPAAVTSAAEVDAEPSPEVVELDPPVATRPTPPPIELPPRVERSHGDSTVVIGPAGGRVEVHGFELVIPEGALSQTVEFAVAVVDGVAELERPWPGGLPLATVRVTPWNPELSRAATMRFPLRHEIEADTAVEVLAWQPAMRSFLVAGRGRVSASGGEASVSMRQLGDMVVRAEPVQRERATSGCDEPTMRLHERWPGPAEAAVVGLVEVPDRLPRDAAFNALSDARLLAWYRDVDFKNEEVVDSPATRRNELAHRDEDFLFDPNAAAAMELLSRLVRDEWTCPLSGEPAYMVRITEGYDSLIEHSQRSTHYQGRAVDLTLAPVPAANGDERRAFYGRLSTLSVCSGFDYVLFENLAHVHASVVPTRYALLVRTDEGYDVLEGRVGAAPDTRRRMRAPNGPDGRILAWTGEQPRLVLPPLGDGSDDASDPLLQLVTSASRGVAIAPDRLKQIVIHEGRAYLVNSVPIPPPGSSAEAPSTVDIAYPWSLASEGHEVVDATFRVHERTERARERLRRR